MIKKFYVSAVFIAVFCISATALFAQDDNSDNPEVALPGFQLLVSGEIGYANNSDMSDFSKAQGESIAAQYNALLIPSARTFAAKETTNPNTNFGFDVDFRFFPGAWGLGLGTGVHIAESVVEIDGGYIEKAEYTTTLVVIPVVATLYYLKPINSFSFLTFGVGVGKYFAYIDGIASSNDTILQSMSVNEPISDIESTIGFNLKAEYTLYFRPFCLTAGIVGRYVNFGEFSEYGAPITEAGLTGVSLYLAAGLAI